MACVFLAAVPACAFTFSYGNLFDVKDVKNMGGKLEMPLARGKYRNVKVLGKKTYDFLRQCKGDCFYPVKDMQFQCKDYRHAFTRPGMLIANVDFNGEMSLTFLVFKNKNGFWIKTPDEAVFKDKKLEQEVKVYLIDLAEHHL